MLLEWTASAEDDGLLLRTFLKRKHISKLLLTAIKFQKDGEIRVNEVPQNVLYRVEVGDKISVVLPE